jgi:hypothetical protein
MTEEVKRQARSGQVETDANVHCIGPRRRMRREDSVGAAVVLSLRIGVEEGATDGKVMKTVGSG